MGGDDKLRSLGRHQENSAVATLAVTHVRSNLIDIERQMKEEPGNGDQVDIGTGLKQLQATGIMQPVDFSQGICLLRKTPFFWHYSVASSSQSRSNHFVLGSVSSAEKTLFSQSEQSSDSKNCESTGQVTRS